MKTKIITASTLAAALFGLHAAAQTATPSRGITVIDEGDYLTISVERLKLAAEPPVVNGNRVEFNLAAPSAPGRLSVEDITVKRVEVLAGDLPKLSVLFHRDSRLEALAPMTRVERH